MTATSYVQVPPDSTGKQVATNEVGGKQYQVVNLADEAGAPIDTRALGSQLVSGDNALVANTVIHGLSTAGGGTYVDVKVNPSGALSVEVGGSAASTLTNVTTGASSITLVAATPSRIGATIYNDAATTLYIKFGAAASTTSFTVAIAAGGYYEVPYRYTGRIDGVLASGTGTARVTEVS